MYDSTFSPVELEGGTVESETPLPPQHVSNRRLSTKQGIAWEERHVANRHMRCKSAAGHDKRWFSRYALPPKLAGPAKDELPVGRPATKNL